MYFIKRNLFRIIAAILTVIFIALLIFIFYLTDKKSHPIQMDFGRYTKYSYKNFILPSGAKLTADTTTVPVGESIRLYSELNPTDSTEYEDVLNSIKWISENSEIAEVKDGIVTGITKGTTIINIMTKMEPSIFLGSIEVTVKVLVEQIQMANEEFELNVSDKHTYIATVLPEDASNKELIWKSSDENIATISPTGEIEAKTEGEVIITATSLDDITKIGTTKLLIKAVDVTEIKLDTTNLTIYPGNTHTFSTTILPANSTYKDIVWESSNPNIVKITNGVLEVISLGEAEIKATTDNGKKSIICKVTVMEDPNTKKLIQNVPYISTYSSGYINGHEAASATMLLRFSGYTVNVKDIIENIPIGKEKYQESGTWYGGNPFKEFVGDPTKNISTGTWGCFAAPLVESMRNFAGARVQNISNCPESTLFSYIDNQKPVIVWCTQNASNLSTGVDWKYVDKNKSVIGGNFQELIGKHCAVLVGYDSNYVYLHDPAINTYVTQPKDRFLSNWRTLYSQAIVID